MLRRFALSLPLVLTTLLPLYACEQALGIEDAQLDPCETYCSTVMANCTGELQQYATVDVCIGTCLRMAVGTEGVVDKNDVQCRLDQAESAGSTGEPQVHCPQAGPAGDACGGDECANFCELFNEICPGEVSAVHEDILGCQRDCAGFGEANGGVFNAGILDGDTLQCRWYHLEAAALDATTHCPHSAGLEKCVPSTGDGGAGGTGGGGTGGAGGS